MGRISNFNISDIFGTPSTIGTAHTNFTPRPSSKIKLANELYNYATTPESNNTTEEFNKISDTNIIAIDPKFRINLKRKETQSDLLHTTRTPSLANDLSKT